MSFNKPRHKEQVDDLNREDNEKNFLFFFIVSDSFLLPIGLF